MKKIRNFLTFLFSVQENEMKMLMIWSRLIWRIFFGSHFEGFPYKIPNLKIPTYSKSRLTYIKSRHTQNPAKNIKALIIILGSPNTEPNIILLKFPGNAILRKRTPRINFFVKNQLCQIKSIFLKLCRRKSHRQKYTSFLNDIFIVLCQRETYS
jgi:hypothetical protein